VTMPVQNQDAPDTPQDAPETPDAPETGVDQGGSEPEDQDAPEGLGDAGKQAIDRMKAERNAARKELRQLREELETLKAPKPKDGEPDLDAIRRDAEKAAQAKANDRIKRADIKAAAAGKLSDPQDALRFLDLDAIEVDDDGNTDTDEISAAIDELLSKKPYLSAQGGRRFQGSADGGARAGKNVGQLTADDLKGMSPEAIVKAKAEGRLKDLGYK